MSDHSNVECPKCNNGWHVQFDRSESSYRMDDDSGEYYRETANIYQCINCGDWFEIVQFSDIEGAV
jgi:predicted nucleic acid-binding Zn ribbon protein